MDGDACLKVSYNRGGSCFELYLPPFFLSCIQSQLVTTAVFFLVVYVPPYAGSTPSVRKDNSSSISRDYAAIKCLPRPGGGGGRAPRGIRQPNIPETQELDSPLCHRVGKLDVQHNCRQSSMEKANTDLGI